MNSYIEHYQQLKPTFIGNHLPWLRHARETSLKQFITEGFPNRHQEDWKYTDLSFLAKQTYDWTPRNETVTPEMIARFQLENTTAHQLVFVDGHYDATLSTTQSLKGVTLYSLNEILLHQPELMESYFSNNETLSSALIHLNTAFISDGFFLHVAKNTHLEQPIQLLFLTTQTDNNSLLNNRNILVLEENANATIFEQHAVLNNLNNDQNIITKNSFTTVKINQGAQLNYYKLQKEHKNTIHLAHTQVEQARDSQFTSHSIALGGKLTRDNLNVALNDTGTICELNGFYALSDKQHTDHHTRIDHFQPQGISRECYKSILKDHAKGVFNGKIMVHPDAQKTKSQQVNKNLLLSTTAEMNTKPELEIYADDVQCTHGATVGQIEEDALFYLRSRGLDAAEATSLLVHAFCDDILQNMRNPHIKQYIQAAVTQKIEKLLTTKPC